MDEKISNKNKKNKEKNKNNKKIEYRDLFALWMAFKNDKTWYQKMWQQINFYNFS